METSGAQEVSCIINDVSLNEIAENVPAASSEVVVESSDSECQFVLALKPPHLRTPEQVSLDSASDSDVVYIPEDPKPPTDTIYSSSSDTEDNKPLSETRKQLKSELSEGKFDVNLDIKNDNHIPDPMRMDDNIILFNYGASTSTASLPDDIVTNQTKKLYYHPIRKRLSGKSIFDSSSSSDSSSSDSDTSDEEWQSKMPSKIENKHTKSSKNRRKSSKKLKKRRVSSTIVSNPKPLSQLPSSEEARVGEDEAMNEDFPRIKSVTIKKYDDQHYIQKSSNSELSSD
jgi:E3 ubiquitin-protein ligase Topors